MIRRRTARHSPAARVGGIVGTVLLMATLLGGLAGLGGPGGPGGLGGLGGSAATTPHVAAPLSAFAETLRFAVSSVTPSVVTSTAGNTLTIRGTVTNITSQPVDELIYRLQRGARLTSSKAVAQEIADPGQPAMADGEFRSFGGPLGAGKSTPFAVAGWIAGGLPTGLQITEPGVYPVMVNVNGTIDVDGTPTQKRLGELHLLVTVTSLPPTSQPTTGQKTAQTLTNTTGTTGKATDRTQPVKAAVPMGFLWPVTSRPHRGVNGVFLDDSLAKEVAPGGALSTRLDALRSSGLPAGNTLLAIDPMLLDELDAMSKGYRVLLPNTVQAPLTRPPTESPTQPPTEVPTRSGARPPAAGTTGGPASTAAAGAAPTGSTTPGSTTPRSTEPNTMAGAGGPAAAAFLHRLRTLAKASQVLVLPYSNPDTVAITRAGMGSTLTTLAATGRSIAAKVLGRTNLLTSVALPPDALAGPDTLQQYAAAGYTSTVLAGSSVTGDPAKTGVATVAAGDGSLPAVLDDSELQPMLTQVLSPSPPPAPIGGQTAVLTGAQQLNSAVATIAQRAIDGDGRPIVRIPDAAIDTGGLDDLGGAIAALSGAGMVASASPTALTAGTGTRPEVIAAFPAAAESRLLSAGYLGGLAATRSEVASISDAVDTKHSPAGAALMRSLSAAEQPLTSAALRTDRPAADATLTTVNATTHYLRAGVAIRPTAGSYTLASADSPLVLTVGNTTPYPWLIKVSIVGGEQAGLVATVAKNPVVLQPGQSEGVRVAVKVSRAGSFPVSAQLTGPDGRPWGPPVSLPIRSSAYGALTIILISVAGGLLLLMVILRIWQRWRQRQKRLAAEAAAEVDSTPESAAGSISASVDDADGAADDDAAADEAEDTEDAAANPAAAADDDEGAK